MQVIKQMIQAGYNVPDGVTKFIKQPKYIVTYEDLPLGLYYCATAGKMPPKKGILLAQRITLFWSRKAAKEAIQRTSEFYAHNSRLGDPESYMIERVSEV